MKHGYLTIIFLAVLTHSVISQITVKGKVKDDCGTTLPGVTISEKGSDNSVYTDGSGNYTITVKDSASVLVFAYICMVTREISVNGQKEIHPFLKPWTIFEGWSQKIRLFLTSGTFNNHLGGQFEFSIPFLKDKFTIENWSSIQTNFNENHFFSTDINLQLPRLSHGTYGSIGLSLGFNYNNFQAEGDINAETFSLTTKWRWTRLRFDFLTGYSHINYRRASLNQGFTGSGLTLGTEFWIPKPINLSVSGKTHFYKDISEFQAEIRRGFGKYERIKTFVKFYNLKSYTELILGVGFEFSYSFRYQKNANKY